MSFVDRSLWILLIAIVAVAHCRVVRETKNAEVTKNSSKIADAEMNQESKQLFLGAEGKETNTPNFVRLVVMRLIYGLASSMGIEERLESAFNGVLVPPNADEGFFNFGDIGGGGGGDDEIFGGLGDLLDY